MSVSRLKHHFAESFFSSSLGHFARIFLKAVPVGTYCQRLKYDAVERPHYGYGMLHAALLAKQLGIPTIAAIEFGVAGGKGLTAMERIAGEIERETGILFEVFGFDTGEGLPQPDDFRDLPYVWQKGFYKMDVPLLQSKLKRAELILGNVSKTVDAFTKRTSVPPIGFVSFDMDYYTSTRDALGIFGSPEHQRFLPRVFCHFDDIVGNDWELHCEDVGELRAIREFNEASEAKIRPVHGLAEKRSFRSVWTANFFVLHRFHDPRYCTYVLPESSRQLQL